MSNLTSNLGWSERLALMAHFGLNDKAAATTFNVSADEVATARELQQAGTIKVADDIDFAQYEGELGVKKTTKKSKAAASTTTSKPSTDTPVTATKPQKEPKKRGRKGDKIKNAFASIPSTPTSAEEFIAEHGISMNVLRQSKRFDTSGTEGTVHVRKDKDTKVLMVWREVSSAE